MQKITNKVKIMPWPSLPDGISEKQRWAVSANLPVVAGERVLVMTFIGNPGYETQWRHSDPPNTFRIVISKKKEDYRFVTPAGKVFLTDSVDLANGYIRPYTYMRIDEADEARLKRFTGSTMTANHYIDTAWHMAVQLREKKRKDNSVAKGEIQPEDVSKCPEALPYGFEQWVCRDVIERDHTLLYKKGNVRGLCYICGSKVRASQGKRFSQREMTRCPECGSVVTAVLEDSRHYKADNVANVATFQKGPDDLLFIRYFRILRSCDAKYEPLTNYIREFARCAIRGTGIKRWTRLTRYRDGWSSLSPVEEQWEKDWHLDQGSYTYESIDKTYLGNLEQEIRGTSLQYACIREYASNPCGGYRVTKYAMDAARYPIMEFLQKGGYETLVWARVSGLGKAGGTAIRWTGKTVKECFKFPVHWLKVLPPATWDIATVMRCNELFKACPNAPRDEVAIAATYDMSKLQEYRPLFTYKKVVAYLSRQQHPQSGKVPEKISQGIIGIYADYLGECVTLKLNLEDRQVLFPPDLQRAHERTSQMVVYEKNKEEQERFQKQVDALDKWRWQQNGLLIRPAMNSGELKREGTALHHCVAGYASEMAKGETAIFIVRKADDPYTPYYTLELKGRVVIQCRTDHNKSYEAKGEEAVKAFIDTWLAEVVNKPTKKKSKPQAITAVA